MLNWKLRVMNGATLAGLVSTVIAFIYQVCGIIGIVPPVSEDQIVQFVGVLINLLVTLGIIVDPTTKGIGDTPRAMSYAAPNVDDGTLDDYEDGEEISLEELMAIINDEDEDEDDPEDDEVIEH